MAVFYNQATLTYANRVTNSNIVTGEILENVTAEKTAIPAVYRPGDDVTYVVNLINSGTTPVTGITMTDDLGAYAAGGGTAYPLVYEPGTMTVFVNGVPQNAAVPAGVTPLSLDGITIPAGGNATVVYRAQVSPYADPGENGTIVNAAVFTGNGLTQPVRAEATVNADVTPLLSIAKSVTPTSVSENGTITYTFEIRNEGGTAADAAENAAITDLFSPVLSDVTVSYNGTLWTDPENYTYDQATGRFSTVPGQITVPAAAYTQDPDTGEYSAVPGVATVTVTGRI